MAWNRPAVAGNWRQYKAKPRLLKDFFRPRRDGDRRFQVPIFKIQSDPNGQIPNSNIQIPNAGAGIRKALPTTSRAPFGIWMS